MSNIIKIPQGFITWELTCHDDNTRRSKNMAYVKMLHVEPSFRGQGYGSELMHLMGKELYKQRVWNICLDNVLPMKSTFFPRMGFSFGPYHPEDLNMFGKTVQVLKAQKKPIISFQK